MVASGCNAAAKACLMFRCGVYVSCQDGVAVVVLTLPQESTRTLTPIACNALTRCSHHSQQGYKKVVQQAGWARGQQALPEPPHVQGCSSGCRGAAGARREGGREPSRLRQRKYATPDARSQVVWGRTGGTDVFGTSQQGREGHPFAS